jgi:hypothetical protein
LIQLVEAIFFSRETLTSDFGGLMIGSIDIEKLERLKQELLPCSVKALSKFFRPREKARG